MTCRRDRAPGCFDAPASADARSMAMRAREVLTSGAAQGRGRGAGGAARPGPGRAGPGGYDGSVAGTLAGLADIARRLHRPQLRRARAAVPEAIPGASSAGRAVGCPRAGHAHRDHPPPPVAGVVGVARDAQPDPGDAACGAERRDPGRADRRQPCQPRRAPESPPSPRGGVDTSVHRALASIPRSRCGA